MCCGDCGDTERPLPAFLTYLTDTSGLSLQVRGGGVENTKIPRWVKE